MRPPSRIRRLVFQNLPSLNLVRCPPGGQMLYAHHMWSLTLLLHAATPSLGYSAAPWRAADPALGPWYDSLAAVTTLAELRSLQPFSVVPGETAALRLSLYQLRVGVLAQDVGALGQVVGRLSHDLATYKKSPWPALGLADAFQALHFLGAPSGVWLGQMDGESHASTTWRMLRHALAIDRDHPQSRARFLELISRIGERELSEDEAIPLQREVERRDPDPRALVAWGRELRARGKYPEALRLLQRAAAASDAPGVVPLELARTHRALGDTAAARRAYWQGLEALTPARRAAYRYDLAWMLDADSLAVFDRVPDAEVGGWLHRFWDERDASAAHRFGERLQEHLRRWVYAVEHYRVALPWRKTMFTRVEFVFDEILPCTPNATEFYDRMWAAQPAYPGDIRARERLLDDRGLIYLRHGAPLAAFESPSRAAPRAIARGRAVVVAPPVFGGGADRFRPATAGQPTQPSQFDMSFLASITNKAAWLYRFGEEWRLLSFRGSQAIGMYAPTTLSSYLPLTGFSSKMIGPLVAGRLSEYQIAWPTGPGDYCNPEIRQLMQKGRADAALAIGTDSDNPPILTPWSGTIRAFALGAAQPQPTRALLTFSVAASTLATRRVGGAQVWPLQFHVVAYEPATGRRVVLDTTRIFQVIPAAKPDEYLTGWLELPLAPGTWQVATRISQGKDSVGIFVLQRGVIPPVSAALSLSDLVPGIQPGMAWAAPDGAPFPVNPLGTWRATDAMELYYEVRGIPPEASYQTTLLVQRDDSTASTLIQLRQDDIAAGVVTTVRRRLVLESLAPGAYRLVVRVGYGATQVERRVPFTLRQP